VEDRLQDGRDVICRLVFASQRVGAKRRPMTGSAKQSILTLSTNELLRC